MSEDRETLPPRPKPEEKSKGRLLDWLDAIAKLVGAAAVLAWIIHEVSSQKSKDALKG